MDIQRLRNLTTRHLHTKMEHIYEDIEFFVGEKGIMTHHLPNAADALEPHLREQIDDPKMWERDYDPTHVGDYQVRPLNEQEQEKFWETFFSLPHPFENL